MVVYVDKSQTITGDHQSVLLTTPRGKIKEICYVSRTMELHLNRTSS